MMKSVFHPLSCVWFNKKIQKCLMHKFPKSGRGVSNHSSGCSIYGTCTSAFTLTPSKYIDKCTIPIHTLHMYIYIIYIYISYTLCRSMQIYHNQNLSRSFPWGFPIGFFHIHVSLPQRKYNYLL